MFMSWPSHDRKPNPVGSNFGCNAKAMAMERPSEILKSDDRLLLLQRDQTTDI